MNTSLVLSSLKGIDGKQYGEVKKFQFFIPIGVITGVFILRIFFETLLFSKYVGNDGNEKENLSQLIMNKIDVLTELELFSSGLLLTAILFTISHLVYVRNSSNQLVENISIIREPTENLLVSSAGLFVLYIFFQLIQCFVFEEKQLDKMVRAFLISYSIMATILLQILNNFYEKRLVKGVLLNLKKEL